MPGILDDTLGAALVGLVISAILYGVTSVQTFMYFHHFKNDDYKLKLLVFVLWILDTVQTALTTDMLYLLLVTSYGNITVLQAPTDSLLYQTVISMLCSFFVQCALGWRIYILCGHNRFRSRALLLIIMLFSLAALGFGLGLIGICFVVKTWTRIYHFSVLLYVHLGIEAVADILIAMSLCTILVKSRTGNRRTDSIINFLMAFSINCGVLTTLCSLACLVCHAIWPQRYFFIAIFFAIGKFHINSFLGTLNARTVLRDRRNQVITMSNVVAYTPHQQSTTMIPNNRGGEISTISTDNDLTLPNIDK